MLVLAIQNSVIPFFWASSMVFWLLFFASVVFLNAVSDYVGSGAAEAALVVELENHFGRLDRAVLTLFMSITGGISWEVPMNAMLSIHVAYGMLFVFFVAAMTLAALNVVAGIFVNDAIEMAQLDRDIVIHAEAERNKATINELLELFIEADSDNSGTLTVTELIDAWKIPEISARFRILGVEQGDAAALFRTLDVDGSESIDIDDFVTGCLRAKTLTRPVDFLTFIRESRRQAQNVHHQFKQVAAKLDMQGKPEEHAPLSRSPTRIRS